MLSSNNSNLHLEWKSNPAVFYLCHASPITADQTRLRRALQVCPCDITEELKQDIGEMGEEREGGISRQPLRWWCKRDDSTFHRRLASVCGVEWRIWRTPCRLHTKALIRLCSDARIREITSLLCFWNLDLNIFLIFLTCAKTKCLLVQILQQLCVRRKRLVPGKHLWETSLKYLHKFSIRQRYGLWLGHFTHISTSTSKK